MASLRDIDGVKESPIKRQKTSHDGYDSQDDSGDDFLDHETIATMPVTQPTQLLSPTQSNAEPQSSIVQVAASSPVSRGPPSSPRPQTLPARASPLPSRPVRPGGILASAMAPAGTSFRAPSGVVQTNPPSRATIDISDDEPPRAGDSSDDEASRASAIKPTTFDSPTSRSSNNTVSNRFREITANSMYRPGAKGSSLSGTVYDNRNRNQLSTTSQISTSIPPSRSADHRKQAGPERAKAVDPMGSIHDFMQRQKIERLQRILPWATVQQCNDALLAKKSNEQDALEFLAAKGQHKSVDLTFSDDEQQQETPKPTAKRQLKTTNLTIQDKWSSRPSLPKKGSPTSSPVVTPQKPRKRLVQGRRAPSPPATSPAIVSPKHSPPKSKLKAAVHELSDDSGDSGVASSELEDGELQGKVLHFLNICSVKDLADISSTSETIAKTILAQRPFKSLDNVCEISAEAPSAKSTKRKTTKRPIGDKVVETCLDTWKGYEAVDELVGRCEELGKPIAAEMKKWGFDVFGASTTGELEMIDLGDEKEKQGFKEMQHDSGIGTPTNSPKSIKDFDAEGDVKDPAAARPAKTKYNSFVQQPKNMGEGALLKDYQLVGLNWLALLYDQGLSCILADEMGLGKTCQVISFLAHLFERGIKGPHLIVVPGSTLENWLREFRRFCPSLAVEPYYGAQKEREELQDEINNNIDELNVIVTTYDLAGKKADAKFLRRLKPNVCVYDEGHALKNSKSLRYDALMRIPAQFRLLLTGTPLQNNLQELAALLGFILPQLFSERKRDLEYVFKHKAKTTDETGHAALLSGQRIARARSMMTPFILRRKKHQVLKHLPQKRSRVEYCDLTPSQSVIYDTELAQARQALAARALGERPTKESGNVMMQLRKAAIHPMLFRRLFEDAKIRQMSRDCLMEPELADRDADAVYEDMEWYSDFQLHTFCEKYPDTMTKYNIENDEWMDSGKVVKLAELLLDFRAAGDRVPVFSQFTMVLDILEAVMETLQMQYFRFDGQTKIDERQDMIDQFYEEEDITVFLLSTKAGGMGINLACANKVVIFDQSFNPQEDIQAENRAHRVGQTREVEVIRLVTTGTIEEQIHALGETKLALDSRVAGEGATHKEEEDAEKDGMAVVERMLRDEGSVHGNSEA